MDEMLEQIRRCEGASGRNVDYVPELVRALRDLGVGEPLSFAVGRGLRELGKLRFYH